MAEVVNQYRVINPTSLEDLTNQVNRIFAQMADRHDSQDGRRGTPTFHADVDMGGNRGTNAANAVSSTDLPPYSQVNTTIDGAIDTRITEILTLNKPVGTIHMTVNPANPATYLGYGTWVAFGTGRVLVGIDPTDTDFDTVEETGGSKTGSVGDHTHSIAAHQHPAGTTVDRNLDGTTVQVADASGGTLITDVTGGGTAAVMPPYIVVYCWKRTA